EAERPERREQTNALGRLPVGDGEGPEREPEREGKGDRRGTLVPPVPREAHGDAMLPYARMPLSRTGRRAGVSLLAVALAVALTWPLAFKLDRVGRLNTGDGQFKIGRA